MLSLQEDGVSGKRPERRAGVLPVTMPKRKEKKMERRDASGTDAHPGVYYRATTFICSVVSQSLLRPSGCLQGPQVSSRTSKVLKKS